MNTISVNNCWAQVSNHDLPIGNHLLSPWYSNVVPNHSTTSTLKAENLVSPLISYSKNGPNERFHWISDVQHHWASGCRRNLPLEKPWLPSWGSNSVPDHGTIYNFVAEYQFSLFLKGEISVFQLSEVFGHRDSPVIYRYKHFLLYITLSTRSP